jgi:hypothetical protein
MSFSYRISPSKDHVHVVGKGPVTADDCIGIVKRVLADPRCLPESTALIDLREAAYATADRRDLMGIAEVIEGLSSMFKNNVAIVARGSTLFISELISAHVRDTAHILMRVFVDKAAAEDFCSQGRLALKSSAKA